MGNGNIINRKILIIGGAGYIGSHLCKALSAENYVVSLDNYSNGYQANHVENVIYIKGENKDIAHLVNFQPDIIFHFGEYSRVEQSFEDIELVWKYNIISIYPILDFAKKNNSKLVYSGSSTKFNKNNNFSPYSWSKATNTNFIVNFSNWFGLDYAITYFYNVYGGNEIRQGKYATLIGIFKEQYDKGIPLTVVKPGTQKRHFTHINDIISGLILVAKSGYGDNYGIGSDDYYSVIEVAKMFNREIIFIPKRKGNRMSSILKTEKIKSLGWKAQHNLKDHIHDYIKKK